LITDCFTNCLLIKYSTNDLRADNNPRNFCDSMSGHPKYKWMGHIEMPRRRFSLAKLRGKECERL